MLQNAYFLAKIGADTAENEQHLPKFCQPTLSEVFHCVEVSPIPESDGRKNVLPEGFTKVRDLRRVRQRRDLFAWTC